jgi:hypothetical protein
VAIESTTVELMKPQAAELMDWKEALNIMSVFES